MARSVTPDSLALILNSVMKQTNENSNLLIKKLNEHMTNTINQINVKFNYGADDGVSSYQNYI